ncbi:MAG: threonine synthase [Candidatus Omnitrophica bacterium CG11_big_fil_rev_8_21_14_0_20_64_10]|nr:MAG: threonine synthase [Candidatus Omnitrophica bacterium CG11_big_fil_rev_8_21_14_0_20_64_10]
MATKRRKTAADRALAREVEKVTHVIWPGVLERYRPFLPVTSATPVVTLQEGNTPLIRSRALAEKLGPGIEVFFKCEGLNPTGSFKDRGMTVAVSKAKEAGAQAVICASTGNTSASAAAYAVQAGMKCVVLLPKGAIALGKLAQALMHGAQVLAVSGNFDDALELVREVSKTAPVTLVNSVNPHRLEGQKTAAFEVCDALGAAPDFHALPVGNAGNITANWRGYADYYRIGTIDRRPKMLGFQAAGAAPLVTGKRVDKPKTIATAIRIGNPANREGALQAVKESRGLIRAVTDKEILEAYQFMAAREGIFVEPASAASVAGVLKLAKKKFFKRGIRIVCTVTGHGLKDPERAVKMLRMPPTVPVNLAAVLKRMDL